MLYNFLKTAFRNLNRQKGFTLLNVLGIGIGIAVTVLTYRFVHFELNFNRNFSNYDRIVRMVTKAVKSSGETEFYTGAQTSAMVAAKNSVSLFEASSRVREYWPTVIVPDPAGGQPLKKLNLQSGQMGYFAEPDFFRIFDFKWLDGQKNGALNEPNALVMARTTAERCFDRWEDALGQTVLVDQIPMVVRGVIEDAPYNSDMPVQVIISYATLLAEKDKFDYVESWSRNRYYDQMFALLYDSKQLEAANAQVAEVGKKEYAEVPVVKQWGITSHLLEPMAALHFDKRFGSPGGKRIEKSKLWTVMAIGLLVLCMACFNFINLSTAQSLRRMKEIGIRKTLGGSRGMLFGRFMGETALITLLAILLGAVLAQTALPLLEHFSDIPAEIPLFSPLILGLLPALGIGVTLLAGFYPALILSGFNPIRALKKEAPAQDRTGISMRKGLVVLQFAIAQALIIGTIVTLEQMNFIRNLDLGFEQGLVYNFRFDSDSLSQSKMNSLKERILKIPGVESVSLHSQPPSSWGSWQTNFTVGRGNEEPDFMTTYKFCDADFQRTYGLELLAGQWFGPSDTTTGYVINETLMRKVGIASPEEAVGQELRLENEPWYPIVGVVKDFHALSIHDEIAPITIGSYKGLYTGAGVKINPKNIAATTTSIRKVFDDTYPGQVFNGEFFDESIAQYYIAENRMTRICETFAGLAIAISCLGLLGLAYYSAQQRTREIGIRKVLGASVVSVVGLLVRGFLLPVAVSLAIAAPVAWYFLNEWLHNFVYHIDMGWWVFALAGIAGILIAFLTVGFHSMKAALSNPVNSLRAD
ncbi:MAG TPA: ABC transporter permease [Flavilitoribacter sp.]|nr:ABC transporter permease [Flavilitoribacter sp.]HMQ89516.1 ABC transporter permease [Flavilitoribacter sp.]